MAIYLHTGLITQKSANSKYDRIRKSELVRTSGIALSTKACASFSGRAVENTFSADAVAAHRADNKKMIRNVYLAGLWRGLKFAFSTIG
jgi:hypothetical protein